MTTIIYAVTYLSWLKRWKAAIMRLAEHQTAYLPD